MALPRPNALIALSGDNRGPFAAGRRANAERAATAGQEISNQIGEEQVKQIQQQTKQLAELESIARGVNEAQPHLDRIRAATTPGDFTKANNEFADILRKRALNIASTGGDPSDTEGILQRLVNQDFDGIQGEFDRVRELQRRMLGGTGTSKLAGTVTGVDADGNPIFSSAVLTDGILRTQTTPIGGQQTKRGTGETIEQQRLGEVGQAGNIRTAQIGADLELAPDVAAAAGAQAEAVAAGTARVSRLNAAIDEGQAASNGLAGINRGISLLSRVGTGRPEAIALEAKRLFGIESGDEGELSNLLGKAVLSQLRETFGAQFTVEEGNRLAAIEAGFSKNNATNLRLLNNARSIAMRAAEVGRRAALEVGDEFTARQIEEAMNFEFSPNAAVPEGLTPEEWGEFTDDEKAQWLN